MSKQARVAPRNIQFKNDVDVRQIPRNDEAGNDGNDGQSWDPNLRNKDVFDDKPKKQRKVVMIVVIGGTVLLLVVIAAVLGGVLSQKSITAGDNSLSYNEACKPGGSQCMSSKNLYCPNGFCVCSSSLTWSSAADKCQYLRYNDACTSASQCDSSLQLTCTNSLCKCNVYYTYNATNSNCTLILNNTLTYGATCAVNSSQCISSLGLTCTGNCSCTTTKVWNGSVCTCASTTFLNASSLCEPLRTYNQTCVAGSIYCNTAGGLSCSSGICVCPSTHYWDYNLGQCAIRRNYSQSCNRDSECAPTLICPTVPSNCSCPDFLPDYVCDCPTTKYYNTGAGQCVNRATLSGSCTATYDYTCLMTLECPAGTCGCPTGKTWNATATKCV